MITRRDLLTRFAILTGSVAFGVATHSSDEDWLVHIDDAAKFGIDVDDLPPYTIGMGGFRAYREGRINLIVALTDEFRDRWMKAHLHCVIERPKAKARRINVFRHYLYGERLA